MKNLVDVAWLLENKNKVILIDALSNFLVPSEGKEKYAQGHIAQAYHLDLADDLSGSGTKHGGRNPLPDINVLTKKLESFGISNDSLVVVYDEGSMYAARFWWLAKYLGLTNVKVLDGGLTAWLEAQQPLTSEVPALPLEKGKINLNLNHNILVDYQEIKNIIKDNSGKKALVDSRNHERYEGKNETIDAASGHIPKALNYFFNDVIDESGKYKDKFFLKEHFKDLLKYDELTFYCGSGVSAAVNILALDELDIASKLYIGSWSDYVSYDDAKIVIETKKK